MARLPILLHDGTLNVHKPTGVDVPETTYIPEGYYSQVSAPTTPVIGDHWTNTSTASVAGVPPGFTSRWNGTVWQPERTPVWTMSAASPTSPAIGDYWVNTGPTLLGGIPPGMYGVWSGSSWQFNSPDEGYVQSATAPTAPRVGDKWKNMSGGIVSGVPSGQTATWTGSFWDYIPAATNSQLGVVQLSTDADRPADQASSNDVDAATPLHVKNAIESRSEKWASQATEPLVKNVGDRWYNSSALTVAGVPTGVTATWTGSFWDIPPSGSSSSPGSIRLATVPEAVAGLDPLIAVTPPGLAAAITASNELYTAATTAPATPRVGDRWLNTNTSGVLSGVAYNEFGVWTGAAWQTGPYLRRDRDDVTAGNVTIQKAWPTLYLNKPASGTATQLQTTMNNQSRWLFRPGNDAAESGANAGSDLDIHRYDDSGAYLGRVLHVSRQNGNVTVDNSFYVSGAVWSTGSVSSGNIVQSTDGNQYARLYPDGAVEIFRAGYAYIDFKADAAGTDYQKRIYTNGAVFGFAGSSGVTYLEFANAGAMWIGGGYGTAGQVLSSNGPLLPPTWVSLAGSGSVSPGSLV